MTGPRTSEAALPPTAGRDAPMWGTWGAVVIALGLLLPNPLSAQTAGDPPAVPHGAPQNADAPAVPLPRAGEATSAPRSRPAAEREAEEPLPEDYDYGDWARGPAEIVGGPRGPLVARDTDTLDLAPAAGPDASDRYDDPSAIKTLNRGSLGDESIEDSPEAPPPGAGTSVPASRPDAVDREEEFPEDDDYGDWAEGPATDAMDLAPAGGPESNDRVTEPPAGQGIEPGWQAPIDVQQADSHAAEPLLDDGLQAQLRSLADDEGFALVGLTRVEDEPARPTEAQELALRLQLLLDGYNYFALYSADGRLTAVHILGEQPPAPPPPNRFFVRTTRRGQHHLVDATLTGPTGVWLQRQMILDTGASTVVLPTSLIPVLGIDEASLSQGWADTAGGRVQAKSGRLAAVAVGKAEARDVPVIFISDAQLGDKALLGMSFLQNFEFTIDDFAQQVILIGK